VGDHLSSTSVVVDKDSGEIVERATYQAFGALDADYRPERWGQFRAEHKFTGKEEDIEVGLTYFGARYYHAHLGRWASADPLTIHGVGSDLNPYAYVGGRVMSDIDPLGLVTCPGCGREVVDEVHVHGPPRGWSREHGEDVVGGSEAGGAWHQTGSHGQRRSPTPSAPQASSSRPSAFSVQLSRIMNQVITAFTNAGTDLAIEAGSSGVFGQAVAGTGLYSGLGTPVHERDATYYAALGGLMVLGGELTATGVFSEADAAAAEGLGSMKVGAGIVPARGLLQRALRGLGTVARTMIERFRMSSAEEEIWELGATWTKAGGGLRGSDALHTELKIMAQTSTGRQQLEYMRQALQGMAQSGASAQELEYFIVLKLVLEAVLR
jgi:RHS repeat-associated protein